MLFIHQHTTTHKMPNRRGNRSMTLQARMQQIALAPLREPQTIAGSKEWLCAKNHSYYNKEKAQESFFSTFTHEEKVKHFNTLPKAFINVQKVENEKKINDILDWINECGWQYIEGGQHDGCWVHQSYPEQIFQGDVVTLECTQGPSDIEFPVSTLEDDVHGIAYRCTSVNCGLKKEILSNKWHDHDSTRKGKLQKRNLTLFNRRFARWQSYEEAEQIKNPSQKQEALAELRMKYHQEDVLRQQNKMGYTDEQIAAEEAFE
jgi:hypothetical protein